MGDHEAEGGMLATALDRYCAFALHFKKARSVGIFYATFEPRGLSARVLAAPAVR